MQYRLGLRLRDVAPVMRYAQCIMIDHSCHWSNVQKPHPQPVLHIHPPQHLRGRDVRMQDQSCLWNVVWRVDDVEGLPIRPAPLGVWRRLQDQYIYMLITHPDT